MFTESQDLTVASFYKQEKRFELIVKSGRENHAHSWWRKPLHN